MAPKKEHVVRANCPPVLAFELTQAALKEAGLKIKQVDSNSGVIIASTGMSLLGSGSAITVLVTPGGALAPNETAIAIRSESKVKTTLFDFGTNGSIVTKFESAFIRLLQQAEAAGDVNRNKWQPNV